MLPPGKGRSEKLSAGLEEPRPHVGSVQILTVTLLEFRLVVPGVEMAGAAVEHDPDHIFRSTKMTGAQPERIGRSDFFSLQGIEHERPEAHPGEAQEITPGEWGSGIKSSIRHG